MACSGLRGRTVSELSQGSRSLLPKPRVPIVSPHLSSGERRLKKNTTQLTIVITVLTVYCYTNISTAQLTIVITVLIVYCVIPISVHQFIKNLVVVNQPACTSIQCSLERPSELFLMKEFYYGVSILGSKNDSELLALTPATYIGNAVQVLSD
eukprot:g46397.t1